MEVSLYDKPEFSKLFKAYYNEKKLSKAVINSTDISSVASDLAETCKTVSLRQSGQMLIGLLKILFQKSLLILNELEEFLQSFAMTPKKEQKYKKNVKMTQMITLNPKKALLAIEDSISVGSYGASTRGSIEIGRNLADLNAITLNDVNYTPKSVQPIVELDDAASMMQEDSPNLEYQDPDLIQIDTPKITTAQQTPARKTRVLKRIPVDKKTLIKKNKKNENIVKEHLKIAVDMIGLDSFELFHKNIIFLPNEVQEKLKELKEETFEFGNLESPERMDQDFEQVGMNLEVQENNHEVQRIDEQDLENNKNEEIFERGENDESLLIQRSGRLLETIRKKKGKVKFSMIHSNERLDTAQKFYELMMLANKGKVSLEQKGFFGEIFIKVNKV
jgi:hypothetical protein